MKTQMEEYESPFSEESFSGLELETQSQSRASGMDRILHENSPFHDSEMEYEGAFSSESENYQEAELFTNEIDSEDYDNESESLAEESEYDFEGIDFENIEVAAAPSKNDLSLPGSTIYVKIDIGKSNYPLNFTGIYVPAAFDPTKPVDVILYLHGMTHAFPGSNARMNTYWNAVNSNYDLRLREEVNASGRNVVFVAPSLGKSPNANYNLLSGKSNGLDNYLEKVKIAVNEHIVQSRFPGSTVDFRAVILCAHSAGGQQMRMIAMANNPMYGPRVTECWGFDSLYGGMSKWLSWAETNKTKKLFIYYLWSTEKKALYLKGKAAGLSNIIVDRSTAKNHYMVPKEHLMQRIQQLTVAASNEAEFYETESADFEGSYEGENLYDSEAIDLATELEEPSTDPVARKKEIQTRIQRVGQAELDLWENKVETDPGMFDHVKRYWREVLNRKGESLENKINEIIEGRRAYLVDNQKKPDWAWSAAFISYIMRKATNNIFPKGFSKHTQYAHWASQNKNATFSLFRINAPEAILEVGDILINARKKKNEPLATFEEILLKGERSSHGDIVIKVDHSNRKATLFGGNKTPKEKKSGSVLKVILDLTSDGKILQKPLMAGKTKLSDNRYIAVVKLMPPLGISYTSSIPPQPPAHTSRPLLAGKWDKAIRLNADYANKFGWGKYMIEINDLVLPYSGYQNVSLGPEAFAHAVSKWQLKQGVSVENSDGIIGPATWKLMKTFIVDGSIPEKPTSQSPMPSQSSANQNIGTLSLGKLIVNTKIPELTSSYPEYQFTSEDAEWLARFVEGEAGGRNDADSHAVIWAMFNRFGMLRHNVKAWKNFAVFIQQYSTTLQPFLNSFGAAQRVMLQYKNSPEKIVKSNETYKKKDASGKMIDTGVPKVQLVRHIKLQRKPWGDFNRETREMVIAILNGRIPNPGIGVATHFASTLVYLETALKKKNIKRKISPEEWRNYTLQYAQEQKWEWIGEKANLNQAKNAFFFQPKLRNVPADAVRIIPQNMADQFMFEEELDSVDREPEYEDGIEPEYMFEGESSQYQNMEFESVEDGELYP